MLLKVAVIVAISFLPNPLVAISLPESVHRLSNRQIEFLNDSAIDGGLQFSTNASGGTNRRILVDGSATGLDVVTFENENNSVNISFSPCALDFTAPIGTWTFSNGNTMSNATWGSIIADISRSPGNSKQQYINDITANARLLQQEIVDYLDPYVCGGTSAVFVIPGQGTGRTLLQFLEPLELIMYIAYAAVGGVICGVSHFLTERSVTLGSTSLALLSFDLDAVADLSHLYGGILIATIIATAIGVELTRHRGNLAAGTIAQLRALSAAIVTSGSIARASAKLPNGCFTGEEVEYALTNSADDEQAGSGEVTFQYANQLALGQANGQCPG